MAETTLLKRVTAERVDPVADTTLLSRQPAEAVAPDSGGESDPDGGFNDSGDSDDSGYFGDAEAVPTRSRSVHSAHSARSARSARARERSGVAELARRYRRQLAAGVAGIVAVCALLALSPVRAELRDSFTRKPQPYTALYFTSRPQVDGTVLTVPVSLRAVDTGTDSYSIHVWTVDAKGKTTDSHITDLKWDGQALSAVVSMPVNPTAEYVWVALTGSDQTLHYKIAVV